MKSQRGLVLVAMLLAAAIGCGGGAAVATTEADLAEGQQAFERRDFEVAFETLDPLAAQSNADAQFMVGFMYFHGRGVERDYDQGMRLLDAAATQGNAEAQYHLAIGHARPAASQDLVQAHAWATIAAQQGYRAAEDLKDTISGQMTEDQVREAKKQVSEWRASQ